MPKKYRVVGGHAVLGNPPGSTFTAELDPDHETQLCVAGHIKVVSASSAPPPFGRKTESKSGPARSSLRREP